jgi:Flp pilus assembly protein TadD
MVNTRDDMRSALASGDYRGALELARRILDADEDDWEAVSVAAHIKSSPSADLWDPSAAISLVQASVGRHPHDVQRWMSLAGILENCGKYGDAEASYRRALALDSNHYDAMWRLGLLYGHPGVSLSPGEARQLFRRAQEMAPKKWEAYYYQGFVDAQLGELDLARSLYQQALARIPGTESQMQRAVEESLKRLEARSRQGQADGDNRYPAG